MNLLRRSLSSIFSPHLLGFSRRTFKSLRLTGDSLDDSSSASLIHGIHVFHCPDEVGIVAKLSECIASRGGNILNADVFVPENKNVFYSRSEFVFDPAKWPRVQMDEDFLKLSRMFNAMRSVVRVPSIDPKYKIAVLASKQGHCLVDLLHGWQDGRLPVQITSVISNHDRGSNTHVIRFLERHSIPYHYIPTNKKDKSEKEILDLVQDTDFLVLARYMQVLSRNFLRAYGKDIVNIHHGLLPSFKGGTPAKQAFDAGVKLIGATSHFVNEELDAGPIIEQMWWLWIPQVKHLELKHNKFEHKENEGIRISSSHYAAWTSMLDLINEERDHSLLSFLAGCILDEEVKQILASLREVERVSHKDNLQSFVQKSQDLEKRCLAKAIKSYCELRVLPYVQNKTVVF